MIEMLPMDPAATGATSPIPGKETAENGLFRYLLGLQLPQNTDESFASTLSGSSKINPLKDGDESIQALAGALAALGSQVAQPIEQQSGVLAEGVVDDSKVSSAKPDVTRTVDPILERLLNVTQGLERGEGKDLPSLQHFDPSSMNNSDGSDVVGGQNASATSGENREVRLIDRDPSAVSRAETALHRARGPKSLEQSLDTATNALMQHGHSAQLSETSEAIAQDVSANPAASIDPSAVSRSEVLRGIESMVYQGGGRMVVTLQPAELGRIELQVTTRGKKVEIDMISDSELGKTALESSMPQLKESLELQNFELTRAEVKQNSGFEFGAGQNFRQSFRESHDTPYAESRRDLTISSRNSAAAMPVRYSTTYAPSAAGGVGRLDVRI